MNLTLIVVVILMLYMVARGYKKGFTRELSGLIALVAAFVMLALGIMLFSSFQEGEVVNTLYSIILLAIFGLVYGVIKFFLRSAKMITHLPILHFLDRLLGTVTGICKGIIIVWILFLLCDYHYIGPIAEYVHADIAKSTILKLLYQYNFFIS